MTFSVEEEAISKWMGEQAYVTWVECPEPWEVEKRAINLLSLPLNIDKNAHHPFYPTLKQIRSEAKSQAKQLPVLVR